MLLETHFWLPFQIPATKKGDSETLDSGQFAEKLRYNAGLSWHDGGPGGHIHGEMYDKQGFMKGDEGCEP